MTETEKYIKEALQISPNKNIRLKESDFEPTDNLFISRTQYKEKAFSWVNNEQHLEILVDQTFENPLYGKTDKEGNAIFPSNTFMRQVVPTSNTILLVHDFVRDSFSNMRNTYERGIQISGNSAGPFGYLRATKAYINVNKQYANFLTQLSLEFTNFVLNNNPKKIMNFNDMVTFFKDFLVLKKQNITRSAYILSSETDTFSAGLSLSLADDDLNNDLNKYVAYVSDPNFSFFMTMCYKFGFTIDKSFPWIIHYNFNYGDFNNVIKKYGQTDYNDMIEKRFFKSFYTDIDILKRFIVYAYNSLYANDPIVFFVDSVSNCDIVTVKGSLRQSITKEIVDEKYNDLFWLKYYFDIRLYEEKINLSAGLYKTAIERIERNYKYLGNTKALEFLNRFVNSKRTKISTTDLLGY